MSAPTTRSGRPASTPGPAALDTARRTLDRPLASYQLVLGAGGLLLGLGLIMVLSASSLYSRENFGGNSFALFVRQAVFCAGGLGCAWVASRLPLRTVRRFAPWVLVGSILLVLATFVPGVGVQVNGNRNWIDLAAGVRLQPSEFAKLGLILWIASHYASRQHRLREPRLILLPMLFVAGFVAALVVAQHDLGTAAVLFAIIVAMVWFAGLPTRLMAGVLAAFGVISVFFVATAPHRVERMLSFLDPAADPDDKGYQTIHALMGFARGGFGGVGLGGSRQKWGALPEAHTDFILAVIGEELGLIGSLMVLLLFLTLCYAGIRIATRTTDPFVRYAAAGITVWITAQALINIAMVLGLLPVIGIPLPLISYGGSSLVVTLVAIGLLLNFATTEPGAKRALAAARSRRARRSAARKR